MNYKEYSKLKYFEYSEVLSVCPLKERIRNVTFIDAPDGVKWLNEGDFVLTTGFFASGYEDWEERFYEFVQELTVYKCSGLGIKLGRHIPHLPEKVQEFSISAQFLIIALSNEYPWTDYLGELANALNNSRDKEIEILNSIYNKFHEHLKKRENLDHLAKVLYTILQIPLTIYLKGLGIRIDYPSKLDSDFELDYLISTVFCGIDNDIQEVRYNNIDFTIKWINEKNIFEGGIFIWGLLQDDSSKIRVAIEQAAIIANLDVEQQNAIKSIEQRHINEFLLELINGIYHSVESVSKKANDLDITLSKRYRIIILQTGDITSKNLTFILKQDILNYMNSLQLTKSNELLIGLDYDNQLMILLPSGVTFSTIDDIIKKTCFYFNITEFASGISREYNFEYLKTCYQEAKIALKVSLKTYDKSKHKNFIHTDFSKLNLERIIYSDSPKEEMRVIYNETLKKIKEYDFKHNTNLLFTLQQLLLNNMNIVYTAQEIYVHKNTVRYRMNLISDLIGQDLNNIDTLILCKIAFNYLQQNNIELDSSL